MKGAKIVKNELDTINPIQSLANIEYYPAIQDVNLPMGKTTKIPLNQINNLGIAFQPLTLSLIHIFHVSISIAFFA